MKVKGKFAAPKSKRGGGSGSELPVSFGGFYTKKRKRGDDDLLTGFSSFYFPDKRITDAAEKEVHSRSLRSGGGGGGIGRFKELRSQGRQEEKEDFSVPHRYFPHVYFLHI